MIKVFNLHSRRNLVILSATIIVMISVAVPMMWRRSRLPLARLAPNKTLAYFEVEDPHRLLKALSSMQAWSALAPMLGLPSQISGVNYLQFIPSCLSELKFLLSAEMALVITGVEMTGDTISPQLCFLLRFEATPGGLSQELETQLKRVADYVYGQWTQAEYEYNGNLIRCYQTQHNSREIAWCIIDSLVLVGNNQNSLKEILDTQARRRPSLEETADFQRMIVNAPASDLLFGYVSTAPISEPLTQVSWPRGSIPDPDQLAHRLMRIFLAAFDITAAYRLEVADGKIVERVLFRSPFQFDYETSPGDLPGASYRSLPYIPKQSRSLTILRVGNIEQRLEKLESLLNRSLSTVSSIALRELLIRSKLAWGLEAHDTIADTLGDEIAVVQGNQSELLFILHASKKAKLASLIGKYLQQDGGAVQSEAYANREIYTSTTDGRRAFCFVDNFLLAGPVELVQWAIDAHQQGSSLDQDHEITLLLEKYGENALEISIRLDPGEEVQRFAAVLEETHLPAPDTKKIMNLLHSLPPTIRTTYLTPEGILIETRSALGEVPFWLIGSNFKIPKRPGQSQ